MAPIKKIIVEQNVIIPGKISKLETKGIPENISNAYSFCFSYRGFYRKMRKWNIYINKIEKV